MKLNPTADPNNRNLEVASVYCFLAQLLSLLPMRLSSFVSWSGSRSLKIELASVVLLLFPICFSLLSVLILFFAGFFGRRIGPALTVFALFAANCLAIAAVQYHLRFGAYPGVGLVRIALQSPRAFVSYTQSGVYRSDFVALLIAASLVLFCIVRADRLISSAPEKRRSRIILVTIVALGFPILGASLYAQPSQRMIVQHTLPWLKWGLRIYGFCYRPQYHARRSIPAAPPKTSAGFVVLPFGKAQHVVIIIAECMRPDHFPW